MRQKKRLKGVTNLYFKKIYMHGFKSFAEPVTIDFHEGITCIVGPNGSGKSNISDAIRWVLGEQSPKALRGGKMDEVIFAGTASRKSRGMAEVTLVIDNSEGILPIDYNEVAITRRMYRSGESEYLINNNQCRLKDIRELIMDTGIGVDGYSIIGQGKIADIVSNKPESRREIFEEAAGIVMYRTKKAEVERKLAASNANLERVNDIVSEIEGRIGKLKTDSEKAAEYLSLRDRYKELEINITLKNIENLELKVEFLKDDIIEAAAEIEALREEKAEIDKKTAADKMRSENLEELASETSAKLLLAVEEINALARRSEVNRERISALDENTRRLTAEIAAAAAKLADEKENAEGLKRDNGKIDEELAQLDNALKDALERYEKLTGVLGAEAESIDSRKNSIYELHSLAQSKRAEAQSLRSLKENLNMRRAQLEAEYEEEQAERANAEKAKRESEAERAGLIKDTEDARSAARTLTEKYNSSLMKERQTAKEIEELRITIGQLSGRKKTIEEMEANYEGYNHAVRYIMKADMRGIEGVVAELMNVPAGYETAIETALGASLQNIVCADDKSAQDAVNILKANRAGRLTFLPLASVRGTLNKDSRVTSAAGFKGYGSECIEFDSKYRNIFEYLLGRTVVVDNMNNAVKLSKTAGSGLRFVTLEGEIINSGGAITGGRYKNNTANLLERKAEIAKLESEIAVKTKSKQESDEKLDELRRFIERTADEIAEANEEVKRLEVALIMCENRLETALSVLADMDESKEKRKSEFDRIEEEGAKSSAMIAALLAEAEKAERDIEEATDETNSALAEYEEKRSALDEINEEIVKARMAVNLCREQKNSIDSMAVLVNERILDLTRELEEKTRERENLLNQRSEITSGHDDTDALVSAKIRERENLESYAAEIAEEKAAVAAAINESSEAKDEIEQKLTVLQDSKYNTEIKIAKNETQLDNFKDKLWEEFEVSYVQAMEFKKKDFVMNAAVQESRKIKSRIKELGEVNVGAIREYEQVSERYEFLTKQRTDILEATNSLAEIIKDMDKTIKARFKESFEGVMTNFEEIFRELFGGGHAQLALEDENNPLESGIEIIAQPPGKKLQNINLMSGGEKTMTAIALMFAVLKTKPTPFCILDEVEAALDDANIDRFANYLKNFEGIQFALVTHQRATMEHADVLYGVTMPEQGISKLISLRLGDKFDL